MRTRMTIPILLVVLALGLLAGPSAMAGELTVVKQAQGAASVERHNDGVTKIPRTNQLLTLPDGRVRYIVQLEDPPVASYRGGIGSFEATSPRSTGAYKLDMRSPRSVAYRGHLRDRQERFARDLQRVAPEARIGHRYQVVFNGFSIAANPSRVDAISKMPGVKRVYPSRLYYQTMDASIPLINASTFWDALGMDPQTDAGAGIKVAVVDGGLYFPHEMFDGTDFEYPEGYPLADDWCADNPGNMLCNGKVIAARHFNDGFGTLHPDEIDSPIGVNGHGTHVAGSAVGNFIEGADAGDGVLENISGVAPAAYLMVYKALWWNGSTGSGNTGDLIAAVDAAVADGADVMNNSWGGPGGEDPYTDAFFDVFEAAEEAGVVAVAAAGNAGPGAMSIGCPGCQPSVLTVARSTHNRIHALTVDMFYPEPLPGTVSQPTDLGCQEGTGPAFTASVGPESVVYAGDVDAGNFDGCDPFPAGSFTDAIALISRGSCNFSVKVDNATAAGAAAVVVFNNVPGAPIVMGSLEATTISSCMISNDAGLEVVDFLGFYPDATGQINYPQSRATNDNWEDFISSSSSRGPNGDPDILKPEIAAPGQTIFSAWSPLQPPGTDPQFYTMISGTSMASPHVAGAAALVIQQHPDWTPTEVKTALTSTTIREGVVDTDGVTPADPFDRGAGRMDLANTVDAAVTFDQTSMANSNCFLECSFDRQLVDQSDGPTTWMASVENADEDLFIEVVPSTIMLPGSMTPPGAPGSFTVYVDTTLVDKGQWYFADIVWENVAPPSGVFVPAPDASMPLAVFASSSTNEALLTKTADKDVVQPTGVITYDITLTNLGLEGEISLQDEIPYNSTYIPDSEEAWVNGEFDPSFFFEPFLGENGSMVWSGMLDPATLDVVPSPSPYGYVSLPGLGIPPAPCSSVCDETALTFTGLPSYEYFGETYNSMVIISNGFVVPGDTVPGGTWWDNQEMPDPNEPNGVIAPFWTDIDMDGTDPGDTGAGIWYAAVLFDGVTDWIVIEWEGVEEWSVPGPTYTFQIWFEAGTSNVWFVYENFDDFPSFLTVGAEDSSGNVGTSYYFNGAGTAPAVGTDLTVDAVQSVAHFSFQVEAGWDLKEPYIVNIVDIHNVVDTTTGINGNGALASAVAITEVEELDVELYIEGECPGIIDVYGYGATPGAYVRVYRGDWPGTTAPLFRRNCSGTEVDLERGRQFPPTVRADFKGGFFHFTRRIYPFQCHGRIQAVDMGSCNVSNTVPMLGGETCGDCLFANGTPGCEHAECESAVCAFDSFCCDTSWDDICAGEAFDICVPDICVPPPD